MAIGTRVNIGTAANASGTTLTITVGAAGVPAGRTISVSVSSRGPDTTTGLPSVSDNKNGAYTQDLFGQSGSGTTKGALFRFSNNAALVENDEITVTIADAVVDSKAATAWYVDGLELTNPLRQSSIATANSATPDSGPITTVEDNQLMIGFVSVALGATDDESSVTQDPDFSSAVNTSSQLGTLGRLVLVGDRVVVGTETQSYTPTLNDNRTWIAGLASYKAAPPPPAGDGDLDDVAAMFAFFRR
jgi:hypothetical protein